MTLSHCTEDHCPGHLGKYQDCLTETVHILALYSGLDEHTGTIDFEGHYTLAVYEEDHEVDGEIVNDVPLSVVPKGIYLTREDSQGSVTLVASTPDDTEEHIRSLYKEIDDRYSSWLDDNEEPSEATHGYRSWSPEERAEYDRMYDR